MHRASQLRQGVLYQRSPRPKPLRSLLTVALLFAMATEAAAQSASQQTWEYSPYDVQIWLACAPVAPLTPAPYDELTSELVDRTELVVGRSWSVQARACPQTLQSFVVSDPEQISIEHVARADKESLHSDKIFLVGLNVNAGGYEISVREICGRTRTAGPLVRRTVYQRELVVPETVAAIVEAFAPLIRIEDVRGRDATVRLRAGGLLLAGNEPSAAAVGDVYQPILRQDDRYGEPLEGGIQVVPWTFLKVQEIGERGLQCHVHSAMRNPVGTRRSARTQRMALRVRPAGHVTQLQVLSQEESPQPLAGYEILAKEPDVDTSAEAAEEQEADVEVIGRTDWRGIISVPRENTLLRIVYVKSGNRLLARLPMVPGLQQQQTVALASDDQRLQAEAVLSGFRSQLMDLVARREVLAAQIRLRLEEKELTQARALLEDLRALDVHLEMQRMLNQQQQRFASSDPRSQGRIDQMFGETYKLVDKYLANGLTNRLTTQLAQAER